MIIGKFLILSFEDDFCKEKLHFEGFCIDKCQRIVVRDGNEIELTYTEFEILLLLDQNV